MDFPYKKLQQRGYVGKSGVLEWSRGWSHTCGSLVVGKSNALESGRVGSSVGIELEFSWSGDFSVI